jgi:integrase
VSRFVSTNIPRTHNPTHMPLTALNVEHAKPKSKPYTIADGGGLHLFVSTRAKRLWRFRYRFGGKANMLSFGSFPEVSLAAARTKREDARTLLADGKDPSHRRKLDKFAAVAAANNTFGAIARELLEGRAQNLASTTMIKNQWMLFTLAAPLNKRPIAEITAAEILAVLKKIELSGRRETARKLRGMIGAVFRYAIATLRAPSDPTYALKGALATPVVVHLPAITDERELGALMATIDEYDGWPTLRAAMQFLALTMARPGEVRFMRRNEIVWPKSTWTIPAERMKMRRPHDVPLSRQALEVLRSLWDLSHGNGLVFPSIRSAVRPLSENAMNSALRRMGYGKDEMCSHGFRSSASTILNERGFNPDVIEAALAHQEENQIRRAYNRAKYWKERVKLSQDWADLLDTFRKEATHRNVA